MCASTYKKLHISKTKTTNGFEVAQIFGFLLFPSVSFLPVEKSAKTLVRQNSYSYSHPRSRHEILAVLL